MTNKGYYYHPTLHMVLIGYTWLNNYNAPFQSGKVIVTPATYGFHLGYKYEKWSELIYIGGTNIFNNYYGYMTWLKDATHEQIYSYFKAKKLMCQANNNDNNVFGSYMLGIDSYVKDFN